MTSLIVLLLLRRLLWSLHGWKTAERQINIVILQNLFKIFLVLLSHLILLHCLRIWLLICKVKLNLLCRIIFWPMIALFVFEEVINKEDMSEVNKAIGSVQFLVRSSFLLCIIHKYWINKMWIIRLLIHWKLQIIIPIFMILVKVLFNFYI